MRPSHHATRYSRYTRYIHGVHTGGATPRREPPHPPLTLRRAPRADSFIWGEKSSGAVPWTTLAALLTMWFCVSVPLVFLGAYFGYRRAQVGSPTETNLIPSPPYDRLVTRGTSKHVAGGLPHQDQPHPARRARAAVVHDPSLLHPRRRGAAIWSRLHRGASVTYVTSVASITSITSVTSVYLRVHPPTSSALVPSLEPLRLPTSLARLRCTRCPRYLRYTRLPPLALLTGSPRTDPARDDAPQLFFILSSIWLHQYYYVFGFLFVVLLILVITCAEITIVMCYFQVPRLPTSPHISPHLPTSPHISPHPRPLPSPILDGHVLLPAAPTSPHISHAPPHISRTSP